MIRNLTAALFGIVLVAVLGSVASAGKNDPGLAAYQRFQSGPPTSAPPAPVEKPKAKSTEIELKAQETSAALKVQEEADLFRRLAVCDRLKQLAMEIGDSKLEEEAMRLEQKAMDVFKERTKSPPAKSMKDAKSGSEK